MRRCRVQCVQIAALRLDDGAKACPCGTAGKQRRCPFAPCVQACSGAAQKQHPGSKLERERAQVLAQRRALALEQRAALGDLDPVAGVGAQRLVHIGQQGDRAGA